MIFKTPHKIGEINGEGGFTLIEVLIAVAIFAIGFLAVGAMQINALTRTNSARKTTEAMTVAEADVEWLRAMPFYDATADLDNNGDVEPYDIIDDLKPGNHPPQDIPGPYTLHWTVTDNKPLPAYPTDVLHKPDGTPLPRSKTIRVWVTPDNHPNDIQADIEFAKFWGMDL